MAKTRAEIDKDMMYRKIMPTAVKKSVEIQKEGGTDPEYSVPISPAVPTAETMARAIRRPAITFPAKEESHMVLVNLMEDLVFSKLEGTLNRFNCCKCDKCKKDIAALALNRLNPHYVVMQEDDAIRREREEQQYASEVTGALVQAILVVKKQPRH